VANIAQTTATEALAGLVERVTFHNPENGFCVLRVKARGQRDLVTVVGHAAMISAGEFVQMSGVWVNDRDQSAAILSRSDHQQFQGSVLRMGDDDTRGTLGRVDSRRGKANAMGVAVATGEDDRCPSTDLIGDLPAGRSCRHREPGFDLTRSEAGSGERSTRGGFWAGRQPWAAATVLPVLRRQCHLKDWRGHRIIPDFRALPAIARRRA
jgi:hypothetical protein